MFQDEWFSLSVNFFPKEFFEKGDFEKTSRRQKKHKNLPRGQRVKRMWSEYTAVISFGREKTTLKINDKPIINAVLY